MCRRGDGVRVCVCACVYVCKYCTQLDGSPWARACVEKTSPSPSLPISLSLSLAPSLPRPPLPSLPPTLPHIFPSAIYTREMERYGIEVGQIDVGRRHAVADGGKRAPRQVDPATLRLYSCAAYLGQHSIATRRQRRRAPLSNASRPPHTRPLHEKKGRC